MDEHETGEEHLEKHEGRTARSDARHQHSQDQQDLTDRITTSHTEQIIEGQHRQDQADAAAVITDRSLSQIIEGVDLLAIQVTTLNERVYHKNYLDRLRNRLIVLAIIFFVSTSSVLGYALYEIRHQGSVESERAEQRENEARQREQDAVDFRRALADCTVAPGVPLSDGYINPGICYSQGQDRTAAAVKEITRDVTESVRQLLVLQAEAAAVNRQLTEEVRRAATAQARALRNLTTTTATTSPPRPMVGTTIPPRAGSTTSTTTTNPGLLCNLVRLLGLCR